VTRILGTLYLVATPIGNLEDITVRALRVLRQVRVIAAEDTRHSLKLLNHYGFAARLISYHDHNKDTMTATLVAHLERDDMALITDAGTPGISDPGYEIVAAALDGGFEVELIPGADAITTLIASASRREIPGVESGMPFRFLGFPPRKEGAFRVLFERLHHARELLVIYESPNRLVRTLALLGDLYGERQAVVGLELSKFYEEIARGSLTELRAYFERAPIRGEVTLAVYPLS